jgi:putative hydrolase of the HAD superfamily
MFTTVLNELMIEPDEAVFIDDSINNLEGVKKLGIHTIWLLRDRNVVREGQYISINDLHQLMTIVINTALLLNIFYMST